MPQASFGRAGYFVSLQNLIIRRFFHPWYRHAIRGKQSSANSPHGWHGDTTDERDSVEPQILPNPIN